MSVARKSRRVLSEEIKGFSTSRKLGFKEKRRNRIMKVVVMVDRDSFKKVIILECLQKDGRHQNKPRFKVNQKIRKYRIKIKATLRIAFLTTEIMLYQEFTRKLLHPRNLAFFSFFDSFDVCMMADYQNDINNCHHDRIPQPPNHTLGSKG
jgi:uncharacterized protein YjhX (UPF0386 family)